MTHLWVRSVDDRTLQLDALELPARYPGMDVAEPMVEPWGWRILDLWNPGGTLWHIAEAHTPDIKTAFNSAPWLASPPDGRRKR